MHRIASLCAAALLVASLAHADQAHWTLSGPAAVTFDWSGSNNTLRYGLTSAYGLAAVGHTPTPLPPSSSGPFWEARLDGLLPGATYHYSIAGGPDHTFRPAPPPGASFTVYAEGDIGDAGTYPRVGQVQTLIADGHPDFVLMLGDLAYADAHGQTSVDRHFNDVMVWSQDAAYMPVWGNHDWESPDDLRNYKGRFELPHPQASVGAPSAGCCAEDWSWFDYGGVRFISYPEPYSGAWSEWATKVKPIMDQAQADPSIGFIVTFGHRPAYSSGHHTGSATLAGLMATLGAAHSKYVLNLNGHSHNYERTTPQSGVIHVTVGTGGSTLEEESGSCLWYSGCPAPPWSAARALHHGALRLRFSPTAIVGEAMCGPAGDSGSNRNDITCAPGDVFDSFRIGEDEAPLVVAPAAEQARPALPMRIFVEAHDPDGDDIHSLTADLSALPPNSGATFVTGTGDTSGVLAWEPKALDAGLYAVQFRAANALIGTATTTIVVSPTVSALPGSSAIFALYGAKPNPARSEMTVDYSLADDAPARLELLDAAGRVLVRRDLGSPGPGRHAFLLGRAADVSPGVYWLRLVQSQHTQVTKIAFLR